jgi:hypothetical protein
MSTVTGECSGVVHVNDVELTNDTIVAGTPPKVTTGTATKFAPEMVTLVPPAAGPFPGLQLEKLGGGLYV